MTYDISNPTEPEVITVADMISLNIVAVFLKPRLYLLRICICGMGMFTLGSLTFGKGIEVIYRKPFRIYFLNFFMSFIIPPN